MSPRVLLTFHTTLVFLLLTSWLSVPILMNTYPTMLTPLVVLILVAVLAFVVVVPWIFMGGCPLTVWENRARKRAGLRQYAGPCLSHYGSAWFGITFSPKSIQIITAVLVLVLVIEIFSY